MSHSKTFLADRASIPWTIGGHHNIHSGRLFLGNGKAALEVAVACSSKLPRQQDVAKVWKNRRKNRAAPVLVVILHPGGATLCGASGEKPPVFESLNCDLAERLCREALDQPDRHASLRFLFQVLPSLETALPGIDNEGFFALHELQSGVPNRGDWNSARLKAQAVSGKRNHELLVALGFRIEQIDNLTSLLRGGEQRIALAVMLEEIESPESRNERFNSFSPVSYALKKADDESLSWVILIQGSRLRLYATATNVGVGRRGRTETWIEFRPSLLTGDHLAYLWLLCSSEALRPNGSLEQILEESKRFSGDLAERLRERIYDRVVPLLAQGIAEIRQITNPSTRELSHTYEMALTVLFRLLFIAYAEDCGLLPYKTSEAYRRRSLKQKAQELAECIANCTPVAEGDTHWQESRMLWAAVARGNVEWGVPAYDGTLFSDNEEISDVGASLTNVTLQNTVFENVLRDLLVIETSEGAPGPVDFRSLGIREFGTIYEGLLESELSLAETDLALDKIGNYVPAIKQQNIVVKRGSIYLHNRSGARKSSGSYYTKPFAVEHLLDGALEPALDDHFSRLNNMGDAEAAKSLFDFRVADIAMGSGHFLISAIDRIERRMGDFLSGHVLLGVQQELASLKQVAITQLDAVNIEGGGQWR